MNVEGLYISTRYDENDQMVSVYVFLYVDNILIVSKDPTLVSKIKNHLHEKYIIKDLSRINQFLKIQIQQQSHPQRFEFSQQRYIKAIFFKFYLQHSNDAYTPAADCNSLDKYHKDLAKVLYIDNVPVADIKLYQQMIKYLLHLANTTCLNIAYTINKLSQQRHNH